MLFTKVASFAAAALTLGAVVVAKPVAELVADITRRQDATSINAVLNNLKSSTNVILPQIGMSE